MIIEIPSLSHQGDNERAVYHFAWRDSIGNPSILAFHYADKGRIIDSICESASIPYKLYRHPAGYFSIASSPSISKILPLPLASLEVFPVCKSEIVLHTVLDRVDSERIFEKWLSHYKEAGIKACSICVNTPLSSSSELIKYVDRTSSRYFENCVVYGSSLSHRYSPRLCIDSMKSSYAMAKPGNFHHLQHLLMHLVTKMFDSEYYLFVDVDEFITLPPACSSLYNLLNSASLDFGYWETAWYYLVNDILSRSGDALFLDLCSSEPYPVRSKYVVKRGAAEYLNIHTPYLNPAMNLKSQKIGALLHLYNLSSYSTRPKRLKDVRHCLEVSLTESYFFQTF
jgi:hypothetical protein